MNQNGTLYSTELFFSPLAYDYIYKKKGIQAANGLAFSWSGFYKIRLQKLIMIRISKCYSLGNYKF